MANISKVLKELENIWEEAEVVETKGFTPVPDGSYHGKLVDSVVEMSQNGRIQITHTLKISDGKYEGKIVKKFDGLDNVVSIGYIKGLLKLIGVTIPKSLDKLPAALEDFYSKNSDGIDVEFAVKTKDEYTNIYINSAEKSSGLRDFESTEDSTLKSDKKSAKQNKKKSKNLSYSDLEDMDKTELISLIEDEDLDSIKEPEKIKESKLRRVVAEELGIKID